MMIIVETNVKDAMSQEMSMTSLTRFPRVSKDYLKEITTMIEKLLILFIARR